MSTRQGAVRDWTDFDEGLLHTLWVVADSLNGRHSAIPHLYPSFVTDYSGGERVYAARPFQLLEHVAPGDGSYLHHSSTILATGRDGLKLTAAAAAGQAWGNAKRRRRAEMDAIPRWTPVDHGTLWVSNHRFWIESVRGLFPWHWGAVRGINMISQGNVHVHGQSEQGAVSWQIVSPAAEMIFALWVLTLRVPHQQWMTRAWIPPNWIPWAAGLGKQTPFSDAADVNVALDEIPPQP